MQPSEMDVVAITESLKRQAAALAEQIAALADTATALREMKNTDLGNAVARFLDAWRAELAERVPIMAAHIAHNQRALAAMRSNIVLPSFGKRGQGN